MKAMRRGVVGILAAVLLVTLASTALAENYFVFSNPTAAPTAETSPDEDPVRLGKTTKKGVNIRAKTDTKATLVCQLNITGTYLIILEDVKTSKGELWYHVEHEDHDGYVRADLIDEILAENTEYQTAKTDIEDRAAKAAAAAASAGSSSGSSTSSTKQSKMVWVTSGGKSYHSTSSCSNMKDPRRITLDEAKDSGRTACPKCW